MFRVATWNINSARLRVALIEQFLATYQPDVLCLQETKSPVEKLPADRFDAAGYGQWAARGEPGYNGVAILTRHGFDAAPSIDFCGKGDARHMAVRAVAPNAAPVVIHNIYIPAGGDEPNPIRNPKFQHKLDFVKEMETELSGCGPRSIVVGDLNIAPLEADVWSHKQLLKVVSHTPVEVAAFEAAQRAGSWVDAVRQVTPPSEKLFSWWSYRAKDWAASDRGRRLDHIWVSPDLAPAIQGAQIVKAARGWEKPSDHAPVIVDLGL